MESLFVERQVKFMQLITSLTNSIGKAFLSSYSLVVIEEEETPLAANIPGTNYYGTAVAMVLITLLLLCMGLWVSKRNEKANYLKELYGTMDVAKKVPLSIRAINDEIVKAEAYLTEQLV